MGRLVAEMGRTPAPHKLAPSEVQSLEQNSGATWFHYTPLRHSFGRYYSVHTLI